MLLLPLFVAAALAGPPTEVRADRFFVNVRLGVVDGQLTAVRFGASEQPMLFWLAVLQEPEAWDDAAYRCEMRWSDILPVAQAVETAAWPQLWPGAAWSLQLGDPNSGDCDVLTGLGDDPVATLAAAGWHVGLGPATPALAGACGFDDTDGSATLYVWMAGAEPMPAARMRAMALDDEGAVTGDYVDGLDLAETPPDGSYSVFQCGLPGPL